MFLRRTAFVLVFTQLAVAPSMPLAKKPPLLQVEAASSVEGDIAAAVNVRDIERFVVAELIRRRVVIVVPSSSAEDLDTSDAPAVYLLTLSIEQMEQAWRPQWNWAERRYMDDEQLHPGRGFWFLFQSPSSSGRSLQRGGETRRRICGRGIRRRLRRGPPLHPTAADAG
jgi:hypothetical protein